MSRRASVGALEGLLLTVLLVASCTLPAMESPENRPRSPATTYVRNPSPTLLSESASATAAGTDAPSPATEAPRDAKTATINIVFDNNRLDPRLRTGWGFAAWIEYGDKVVLFDTGAQGAVLLDNMATLDLDPQAIDIVVLSHNHGDHMGGLAAILSANPRVTIYVPNAFPAGIKKQLRSRGAELVQVGDSVEILPGLWTTGQMGRSPVEQGLAVQTAEGLVLVTGCAHPGVDRMVAQAKEIGGDEIHLVVGGFHLGRAGGQRVKRIVAEFRRLGVEQVAPSHCTGDGARDLFRGEYGEDYHTVGVGWHWRSQARPTN